MKRKPSRKVVRAAIRGSVPDAKLAKARILLSDAPYGATRVTGFTEYGTDRKTVSKLSAPDGDNAFAVTVRGHETRHATRHTPTRKKPQTPEAQMAGQIVDDVNVETLPLPTGFAGSGLEDYRRAHIATAMHDLRNLLLEKRKVESGRMPDTYEARNNRLLGALRIKAMLAHYRDGGSEKTTVQSLHGSRKVRDLVGADTSKALHKIIGLAKSRRTRAKAISMLTMLLERAPSEDNDAERLEELLKSDPEGLLMPVTDGDALEGKMEIRDLRPKTAFTAKQREITRKYAPDGVHLNTARYVNAIVSGDANGLFARRLRHKIGGTVVIDASGSMGATAENLAQLAATVPTATIAYYSGNDAGQGTLTVYALKGKRYSGSLPNDTLHGGNAVDLPAVRWLMANPKPWTLVSDLEFTGGVLGSETIAHALVERAVGRGELTVHASLDAAFEAFGGKGNLGDAVAKHIVDPSEKAATLAHIASHARASKARAERAKTKHAGSFKSKKGGKSK